MTERDTDGADRSGTPADAREPAGPVESADPADDATGELTEAQLLAEIDAELAAEIAARPRAGTMLVGTVLLIGALVGWIASLNLTVDKMYLLAHPDAELACGTVMVPWRAEALGIPTVAIGLGGFAIMGVLGAVMLSGAALPAWMRWARLGGMAFALGYVHFLAYSAIFVIRSLCPWCMVVW